MADNNSMKLGFMFVVGFLCIQVGLTGRLGSLLGAVIDPQAMQETNQPGGTATGIGPTNLPTGGTLTPTQIGGYAIKAGIPANNLQVSIAICLAESGGRVKATNSNTNGSTDYGLWQINSVHGYDPGLLLTPTYNAQAAYNVSNGGTNWHPWTTYQNGAYLSFMAQALAGAQGAALQNVGA